jgi:hypothetical protein
MKTQKKDKREPRAATLDQYLSMDAIFTPVSFRWTIPLKTKKSLEIHVKDPLFILPCFVYKLIDLY